MMRSLWVTGLTVGLLLTVACGDSADTGRYIDDEASVGGSAQGLWGFPGDGSLHAIVADSEAVVLGEVVEVVGVAYTGPHDLLPEGLSEENAESWRRGFPTTTYRIRVDRWLKGSGTAEISVSSTGGITPDGPMFVDGDFLLEPGRKYVMALDPTPPRALGDGEYARKGGSRGAFEVTDGYVHVLNDPITQEIQEQYNGMPLDDFVALVNTYATTPYTGPNPLEGPPPSPETPPCCEGTEPHGNLSVDASPGDNTASSVGPIGDAADVTDTACGDGNPEIVVELVVGNHGGGGSIPAGEDIRGWQARIQFDPAVLTFAGFQVSDSPAGAQFFMEKASDQTPLTNNHITVVDPQPGPGTGTFDIGSTIIDAPPGANGVGLLARLFFDCAASGGTCIDIGDSGNSFYADTQEVGENHNYVERNSASLGVNGGTAPASCP
jgi:hypothetical protein